MVSQARRILLGTVLAALAACPRGGGDAGPPPPQQGAWVSLVLPALDGGEIDLVAYRGHVLVVHFFTTWSVAASLDVAELRRTRAEVGEALAVVGVGLDPEGYKFVAPWRDAEQVEWMVALPTPQLTSGHTVFGNVMAVVPSTVVVDRQGRIAWSRRGQLARGELAKVVRSLEAAPGRP